MKTSLLIISLAGLLLLGACGQFIYLSPTVKTPLFKEKNDVAGYIGLGGAGGEIYAAYAPTNYLGFSAAFASISVDSSLHRGLGRQSDLEFSAIPFYSKDFMRFEIPLGVGLTRFKSNLDSIGISNPYTRLFAQPTFGMVYDNLEFAVFMRVSQLGFSNSIYGKDMRYEPGISIRAGHKNVKIMGQVRLDGGTNYSKRDNSPLPLDQRVEYIPIHISTGITIALNAKKKSANSAP